jgi:GT2 family glycosyltransferase
MSLAVILLNWHSEQQTLQCARAIATWQTLKPRLYVVDNESSEASRAALAAVLAPESLLHSPLNLGYAGGNNLGIRRALAAQCRYILLHNSDAEISEAGVSKLVERLNANPQIAVLGPVIRETRDGRSQLLAGGRDIARHMVTRVRMPAGDPKKLAGYPLVEVDYVPGTVFLARADVFTDIGLLDEEYFFSGEIADFCKRVQASGRKVCIDLEIEARHHPGQAAPRMRETLYAYYSFRNRFLFVTRHHTSERTRYFAHWTVIGVLALMRALVLGRAGKARAIGLALADAYAGRYGNRNASFL